LNRSYDLSTDVFSAGVVLFILLTGYPPFEEAHKNDQWYRPLAKENYRKFWEMHSGCPISNDADAKDLIQRMLAYNPKKRITIAEIQNHKWFNDKFLEGKDLIRILRNRHRQMEHKRRHDAKKLKDLQNSLTRAVEGLDNHKTEVPLYPLGEVEGVFDIHTISGWKDVYNAVNTVVNEVAGHTTYNFDDNTLTCTLKLHDPHLHYESLVKFHVQVFRSREFQNGPTCEEDSDKEDIETVETVYVVRLRRLEGDVLDWKKILNQIIYKKCSMVLTGLPRWARRETKKIESQNTENDDYDNLLMKEGEGF